MPQRVALSPDGWRVAVALANASLRVFDLEDKQCGAPWEVRAQRAAAGWGWVGGFM